MHPIITRDLMKAWITGLHRQVKQNAPFTPAYTIAELTGRALMLLRFRGPSPTPRPRGQASALGPTAAGQVPPRSAPAGSPAAGTSGGPPGLTHRPDRSVSAR